MSAPHIPPPSSDVLSRKARAPSTSALTHSASASSSAARIEAQSDSAYSVPGDGHVERTYEVPSVSPVPTAAAAAASPASVENAARKRDSLGYEVPKDLSSRHSGTETASQPQHSSSSSSSKRLTAVAESAGPDGTYAVFRGVSQDTGDQSEDEDEAETTTIEAEAEAEVAADGDEPQHLLHSNPEALVAVAPAEASSVRAPAPSPLSSSTTGAGDATADAEAPIEASVYEALWPQEMDEVDVRALSSDAEGEDEETGPAFKVEEEDAAANGGKGQAAADSLSTDEADVVVRRRARDATASHKRRRSYRASRALRSASVLMRPPPEPTSRSESPSGSSLRSRMSRLILPEYVGWLQSAGGRIFLPRPPPPPCPANPPPSILNFFLRLLLINTVSREVDARKILAPCLSTRTSETRSRGAATFACPSCGPSPGRCWRHLTGTCSRVAGPWSCAQWQGHPFPQASCPLPFSLSQRREVPKFCGTYTNQVMTRSALEYRGRVYRRTKVRSLQL